MSTLKRRPWRRSKKPITPTIQSSGRNTPRERFSGNTFKNSDFYGLLKIWKLPPSRTAKMGTYYLERYALHWEYCEGARDTFFHIADRYPVGVLTNGFAEVQRAKLDRFGEVRDRLTSTVISEEIGFMKPHPELFKHATSQAQSEPSNILYIGDSFFSDVEGGLNAGWQVIWYAPGAEDIPNGITHIRRLSDLQEIL